MRTNGFICIALSFLTAAGAGSAGYLAEVGPIPLRFRAPKSATPAPRLPAIPLENPTSSPTAAATNDLVTLPPSVSQPPEANSDSLMHDPPILDPTAGNSTNQLGPLIGPLIDTNGAISPQTFLRFFVPPQGGISKEALIAIPPGFTPAQPPARSSTATYSKPK